MYYADIKSFSWVAIKFSKCSLPISAFTLSRASHKQCPDCTSLLAWRQGCSPSHPCSCPSLSCMANVSPPPTLALPITFYQPFPSWKTSPLRSIPSFTISFLYIQAPSNHLHSGFLRMCIQKLLGKHHVTPRALRSHKNWSKHSSLSLETTMNSSCFTPSFSSFIIFFNVATSSLHLWFQNLLYSNQALLLLPRTLSKTEMWFVTLTCLQSLRDSLRILR